MGTTDRKRISIGSSEIYCKASARPEFWMETKKYDKVFLLVDENTNQYCLPAILKSEREFFDAKIIIPSGETNKTLETAKEIWQTLLEINANRKSLLVNLGGGTITDIGGFAASTFMRGIPFVNIPTTLLAMIDASIGGKTGVDYQGYKNYLGTFHFPEAVYIIPSLLESLDVRQLKSGFAELIKHAIVADAELWQKIEKYDDVDFKNVEPLIRDAIQIKVDIVNQDFREAGERKKLNFGHTVGHAIESLYLQSGKNILHGEAVAIGMLVESSLSVKGKLLSKNDFEKIESIIRRFFPIPSLNDEEIKKILHLIHFDKKNHSNKIHFSLPAKIGSCHVDQFFAESEILFALKEVL